MGGGLNSMKLRLKDWRNQTKSGGKIGSNLDCNLGPSAKLLLLWRSRGVIVGERRK